MKNKLVISYLGFVLFSQTAWAAQDDRPNILLIVAEDMSSRIASFGDEVAYTPHLDSLAGEGVRYTNVFTTSGVCAPSRSAIITGVHQNTLGTQHMRTSAPIKVVDAGGPISYEAVPPAEVKAFPETLRKAGYCTVNVAKTDYQFGNPSSIWDHDLRLYSAAPWRKCLDDVERGEDEEKPFFVYTNMLTTHESSLWPAAGLPKHSLEGIQKIANFLRYWDRPERVLPEEVEVPPYLPDTQTVREDIARQYNNIALMDEKVGEVLQNLAHDGLEKNTLVIFTTDHGDGLVRAKRTLYNSGIKVPLIIRWQEYLASGEVNKDLISFVDLAPTILAAAQVPIPSYVQGNNIFDKGANRQYCYAARDRMDTVKDRVRSINDKQFKLIKNYAPVQPLNEDSFYRDTLPSMRELRKLKKSGELTETQNKLFASDRPVLELYDYINDPHEINNLADKKEYQDIQNSLEQALELWIKGNNDFGFTGELEMIESMWPDLVQPITVSPSIKIDKESESTKVLLESKTEGASVVYRIKGSDKWMIYSEPLVFSSDVKLEAKAVRYGYKESEVVSKTTGP